MNNACTHDGARGRRDRFSTVERRFRCCECVGESWCGGGSCLLLKLGFLVKPRHTHISAVCRHDRFSTVQKRRWDCAHGLAQFARVSGSMERRGRLFCLPRVSGLTDACTYVGVAGRRDRFSTVERQRRESSRRMLRRGCAWVCVCARQSIGLNARRELWQEGRCSYYRRVATVGWRV